MLGLRQAGLKHLSVLRPSARLIDLALLQQRIRQPEQVPRDAGSRAMAGGIRPRREPAVPPRATLRAVEVGLIQAQRSTPTKSWFTRMAAAGLRPRQPPKEAMHGIGAPGPATPRLRGEEREDRVHRKPMARGDEKRVTETNSSPGRGRGRARPSSAGRSAETYGRERAERRTGSTALLGPKEARRGRRVPRERIERLVVSQFEAVPEQRSLPQHQPQPGTGRSQRKRECAVRPIGRDLRRFEVAARALLGDPIRVVEAALQVGGPGLPPSCRRTAGYCR